MKKYLFSIFVALVVGFFLSYFFINQYYDFDGVKVSLTGENLYFVQFGVFSSKESLEENTISIENYIYNIDQDMYYVFVGITKSEENAIKIQKHYEQMGYDTIIKNYQITNNTFLKELENYDSLLLSTEDDTVISSLINQTLTKYEEVVINGGKN